MNNKYSLKIVITFLFVYLMHTSLCLYAWAGYDDIGVALSDQKGELIYKVNSKTSFIPASTLKILTSLTAIKTFGKKHSFKTDFYYDQISKDLYIKGYGDPLFISEVIEQFSETLLATYPIQSIRHLIIDQTYFSDSIRIPGKGSSLNPYDAPIGALCANFNTVMFERKSSDRFISAEPQTPLLPEFTPLLKETGLKKGRIIIPKKMGKIYAGLLIRSFLEKRKITFTGTVQTGKIPAPFLKSCKTFFSPYTAEQLIQMLLKYSNNFIANQLLLIMGAEKYGAPATLEKGRKIMEDFATDHLKLKNVVIKEGSGLSRANRISPEQMIKVLIKFLPHHTLLSYKDNDFFKTGTLSDVRTRAGYLKGKDGNLYPYVIMVNQEGKDYKHAQKKLISVLNAYLKVKQRSN